MKLIMENWRRYLTEEKTKNLGAIGKFDKTANAELVLIDLDALGRQLRNVNNIDDFIKKIDDVNAVFSTDLKSLRGNIGQIVVGYIWANNNKYTMKAAPSMGGSGGPCMNTFSVRRSIGQGYGKELYNALLGLTYPHYITADRTSVSVGAGRRWEKIASQTSDSVPSDSGGFIGKFDRTAGPQGKGGLSPNYPLGTTPPREDDCVTYDKNEFPALDKGFRDEKQVRYYKTLKVNLDGWFEKEVEKLFAEPGFFAKLLGNTPKTNAEKLKKKLLSVGMAKFSDFEANPSQYVKDAENI